jgi:hypothetical protein
MICLSMDDLQRVSTRTLALVINHNQLFLIKTIEPLYLSSLFFFNLLSLFVR